MQSCFDIRSFTTCEALRGVDNNIFKICNIGLKFVCERSYRKMSFFFFLRNCPDHRLFFVPFCRRKGKKVKAMEKQEKVNQPKTQPTTSKKETAMKRRKTERRESKTMTLTK